MVTGRCTALDGRLSAAGRKILLVLGLFGGYGGDIQRYDNNEADGNGNHNNLTVGVDYRKQRAVLLGGLMAVMDKQHPDTIIIVDAVFRPAAGVFAPAVGKRR